MNTKLLTNFIKMICLFGLVNKYSISGVSDKSVVNSSFDISGT